MIEEPNTNTPSALVPNTETFVANDVFFYKMNADNNGIGVGTTSGKLKIAQSGLGWKDSITGQVITLPIEEWKSVLIIRVLRGIELRIFGSNGDLFRFDSISPEQLSSLKASIPSHLLSIPILQPSTKGWNWGDVEIGSICGVNDNDNDDNVTINSNNDKSLLFKNTSSNIPYWDIPLKSISSTSISTKNELFLELNTLNSKKQDNIIDLRFLIPKMNGIDRSRELSDRIKSLHGAEDIEDLICKIPVDVQSLGPRGKFEMEFYKVCIRLFNNNCDHKIPYSSITKVFLLPKADDIHIILAIGLDPPIRQGQSKYPYLLLQFDKESSCSLEGGSPIAVKEKPVYELISQLIKDYGNQKIIVCGSFGIGSDNPYINSGSIKAQWKASEGYLYPLERNFIFIPKPCILIPHSDISVVELLRTNNSGGVMQGNPRTFDVKFWMKSSLISYNGGVIGSSTSATNEISITSLSKEALGAFEEFLKMKGIDVTRRTNSSGDGEISSSNRAPVFNLPPSDGGEIMSEDEDIASGRGGGALAGEHGEEEEDDDDDYAVGDEKLYGDSDDSDDSGYEDSGEDGSEDGDEDSSEDGDEDGSGGVSESDGDDESGTDQ